MKRIVLTACLLLSIPLQAQDFLQPDTWWYIDTTMPLNDYRYQYQIDEFHTPTGILAWQNDTIAFAEFRHYEFYKLYTMKVSRKWVKTLEEMADAAVMTANHFAGEITGLSLSQLRTPNKAAINRSPIYGRALKLDQLMDSIAQAVMQGDSTLLYRQAFTAHLLGCDFRRDYPLSWYRPSVGIGYAYHGEFDFDAKEQEQNKRWQWLRPLTEQHDLFQSSSSIGGSAPSMILSGRYLDVTQLCDREVDSVMINRFALDRREQFVLLSRALCVDGYEPKVEITLCDTVTQRRCYVDEWRCRMLLPPTDSLSAVSVPMGQGSFVGASPNGWLPAEEKDFKRWW